MGTGCLRLKGGQSAFAFLALFDAHSKKVSHVLALFQCGVLGAVTPTSLNVQMRKGCVRFGQGAVAPTARSNWIEWETSSFKKLGGTCSLPRGAGGYRLGYALKVFYLWQQASACCKQTA